MIFRNSLRKVNFNASHDSNAGSNALSKYLPSITKNAGNNHVKRASKSQKSITNIYVSNGVKSPRPKPAKNSNNNDSNANVNNSSNGNSNQSKLKPNNGNISPKKRKSIVELKEQSKQNADKRRMRNELTLAKMQFKLLKAKLGLEQQNITKQNSSNNLSTNDDDKDDDSNHSRSSTVMLFNTIESMTGFGDELQQVMNKVDELQGIFDRSSSAKPSDNIWANENKELKAKFKEMKKKYAMIIDENRKLKEQIKQKGIKKKGIYYYDIF